MDSITVSWEHDNECSCHVLYFMVTWWKTNTTVDSTMVVKTTFEIESIESDTNYTICVSVVCPFDDKVESEKSCIYNATTGSNMCIHIRIYALICMCTHVNVEYILWGGGGVIGGQVKDMMVTLGVWITQRWNSNN